MAGTEKHERIRTRNSKRVLYGGPRHLGAEEAVIQSLKSWQKPLQAALCQVNHEETTAIFQVKLKRAHGGHGHEHQGGAAVRITDQLGKAWIRVGKKQQDRCPSG